MRKKITTLALVALSSSSLILFAQSSQKSNASPLNFVSKIVKIPGKSGSYDLPKLDPAFNRSHFSRQAIRRHNSNPNQHNNLNPTVGGAYPQYYKRLICK